MMPALFLLLFSLVTLVVIARLVYMFWRHHQTATQFPERSQVNILFEERWASGHSDKSFFTRMGGANNCLHITLTDQELWVAVHSPFSALASQIDLHHRIMLDAVTNIEQNGKWVHMTFMLEAGDGRKISLRLRNADHFYKTIMGIEMAA